MSTPNANGARALTRTLGAAGVTRIFTLSGNHIMPVFDAALDAGIELIHVRHEAAAVHMADAWARLTGEAGIAMVTGGPGHANAVGALYTALMAESPVVLLSGHAPHRELGHGAFQEMAQGDIAAPLTKASWTNESANCMARDVALAIATARHGRPGPVHLSLPTDCLEAAVDNEAAIAEAPREALDFDAAAIVGKLRTAKRALVLTGPATLTKAGRVHIAQLETALGLPVVGMESPRGIADPSLGAFAQVLAQADLVVLLGKRPDFTLKFAKAPAFAADCEIQKIATDTNVFAAIDALIRAAREQPPVKSQWFSEVHGAIGYRPAVWNDATSMIPGRMHPVQALRPLQAILDSHPDSVFVSDGGEVGQWAQACLSAPNRVINGVAGSIGAALPFAVAARAAKPGVPVIAVMGDGTFGFHPAEIDTAVRYDLPFVAIVGNDARWNAEYQIQVRDYGTGRTIGTELLPTRYDKVAEGFGGYGELVTDPAQVLAAARRAMASNLPAVLNVMIDGVAAPVVKR
ncbi:MAG TPA: thiamine pyrophosphate-binding protein [Usitatibacter sp.]